MPDTRDYALKLAAAFLITAVLGFAATRAGLKLPEKITPVAWALLLGGIWMIGAEHFAAKRALDTGLVQLTTVAATSQIKGLFGRSLPPFFPEHRALPQRSLSRCSPARATARRQPSLRFW